MLAIFRGSLLRQVWRGIKLCLLVLLVLMVWLVLVLLVPLV